MSALRFSFLRCSCRALCDPLLVVTTTTVDCSGDCQPAKLSRAGHSGVSRLCRFPLHSPLRTRCSGHVRRVCHGRVCSAGARSRRRRGLRRGHRRFDGRPVQRGEAICRRYVRSAGGAARGAGKSSVGVVVDGVSLAVDAGGARGATELHTVIAEVAARACRLAQGLRVPCTTRRQTSERSCVQSTAATCARRGVGGPGRAFWGRHPLPRSRSVSPCLVAVDVPTRGRRPRRRTQHMLVASINLNRQELADGNDEWRSARTVLDRVPGAGCGRIAARDCKFRRAPPLVTCVMARTPVALHASLPVHRVPRQAAARPPQHGRDAGAADQG